MTGATDTTSVKPGKRKDAVRNRQALLDAAAAVFVTSGVDAPVREIAERAGIGVGTMYRHFPTRADLVVAVSRHQVDELAAAGPALLRSGVEPADALHVWISRFVDFLATKHGLPGALSAQSDDASTLHRYFLEHLVRVADTLLSAATAGRPAVDAFAFLRGLGNLCIGGRSNSYDPAHLAHLLVEGVVAAR